jgi:hypothetical protein
VGWSREGRASGERSQASLVPVGHTAFPAPRHEASGFPHAEGENERGKQVDEAQPPHA